MTGMEEEGQARELLGQAVNSSKISKIKQACTDCKRRKVRCDGMQPCHFCKWYNHPERCFYAQQPRRQTLTRKVFDTMRSQLEQRTSILDRLFPYTDLDSLLPLSRDALIDLLHSTQWDTSNQTTPQDRLPSSRSDHRQLDTFEYDEPLSTLEGTEVAVVADDVNSLSLRRDRHSSYLGPSSAAAGLRVLLKIVPESIFGTHDGTQATAERQQTVENLRVIRDPNQLVDSYFAYVHPVTPILDEAAFRATFTSGRCQDPAWLALLNMVFALGTIAMTTSDSNDDIHYYNIAKSYVGFDGFGSGHLETLQALMLMAGWYLHYRNRPNMASAILGAVFRMAYAVGLHREWPGNDEKQAEQRRRIWWSLVVFDTGESITFGRVASGHLFNLSVNVPKNIDDKTGEVASGPTAYSMLIADVEFSRLASQIQERLLSSPLLPFPDMLTLDAHLVCWYESLPSVFRDPHPCPKWFEQPRASSKWRYQNLRIMLHRASLLDAVMRHVSFSELDADQKVCVRKCQSLARSSIESISAEWTQNQYSGWPAVWYLFQACVIPLICLYSFNDDENRQHVDEWDRQVRFSIDLLRDMGPWSVAAKSTCELVSTLYDSYREGRNTEISDVSRSSLPSQFFAAEIHPSLRQATGLSDSTGWALWDENFDFVPEFPELFQFLD